MESYIWSSILKLLKSINILYVLVTSLMNIDEREREKAVCSVGFDIYISYFTFQCATATP